MLSRRARRPRRRSLTSSPATLFLLAALWIMAWSQMAVAKTPANCRMRVLLQRVSRAEVRIRTHGAEPRTAGRIARGYVLLVGFTMTDTDEHVAWMAEKVNGLRLFADADDKMNLALADVSGAVLVVSQFTLYGDTAKGRRPSWLAAAPPDHAEPLVDAVVARLRELGAEVETGRFRTDMAVALVNDGPVTVILEV